MVGPTTSPSSRPRRGSSRPLWLLLAGVLVAWVALWAGRTAWAPVDVVPWRTDLDAALQQAQADGRPVFINFTADWCPPCQQMKADVYSDPAFAAWLDERMLPVKVDLTAPTEREETLAARFLVDAIPTQIVLAGDGTVLARSTGYLRQDAFRARLASLTDKSSNPPVESPHDGS